MHDAANFRFERVADSIEQLRQCRVARCFLRRPVQRGKFFEVSFQRVDLNGGQINQAAKERSNRYRVSFQAQQGDPANYAERGL